MDGWGRFFTLKVDQPVGLHPALTTPELASQAGHRVHGSGNTVLSKPSQQLVHMAQQKQGGRFCFLGFVLPCKFTGKGVSEAGP